MSARLRTIVDMVPEAQTVADIGCDHGKVAVSLVKKGRAQYAVCSDISGMSLLKAQKLVAGKGLQTAISLREGDGLAVLDDGEADVAVIAGMGGELIRNILKAGGEKTPDTLVLSCNTASGLLRKWLSENGFMIEDEELVFEQRRFYPVMRAVRGESKPLSEMEMEFGPVMLQKKPKVLKYFVRWRIDQTRDIEKKLRRSHAQGKEKLLEEIGARLEDYEEVLKCL